MKTNANAVIIVSSTQQMLINIGHILKDDFTGIIVEDPGFAGAKGAYQFHRFMLETIPVYRGMAN